MSKTTDSKTTDRPSAQDVRIGVNGLEGFLTIPAAAKGLVIFAHGSGSSRFSPRNTYVANALVARGFATLLFDLLTAHEAQDRRNVFDIALLGERVVEAVDLISDIAATRDLPIGLFGASTGAGAALVGATRRQRRVNAVVSRGGRPDLAGGALANVKAPVLLIVGGLDPAVIDLNKAAMAHLACPKELLVVDGATHLFEEPGTLEAVVEAAARWFERYLGGINAERD